MRMGSIVSTTPIPWIAIYVATPIIGFRTGNALGGSRRCEYGE
ncbi:MAG: hypothetical protein QXQ57_02035 [Sulfolobales archaeon]